MSEPSAQSALNIDTSPAPAAVSGGGAEPRRHGDTVRLHVHVAAAGVVLVSARRDALVSSVADGAVHRMRRITPHAVAADQRATELRLAPGGPLIDSADTVDGLLHDNEHLYVATGTDVSSPTTATSASTNGRPSSNEVSPLVSPKAAAAPSRVRTTSACTEESVLVLPDNTRDAVVLQRAAAQTLDQDALILTGRGLDFNTKILYKISKGYFRLQLSNEARQRVARARKLLDEIVQENRVVYGVTTGFGNFANVVIDTDKIEELQQNLIRSHACGVGQPLSLGRVRMLLALRINVLAKGYSGISLDNLDTMIAAFNACCLSLVPQQGTVGCSGDLAPLAHLALGLMGDGYMWSPKTGWAEAAAVLAANRLEPIVLGAKEGIAMINGTQMVSSIAAEVIERADALARQADVIAALTLDILKGSTTAFDPDIHRIRPHPGQMKVAERLRCLLHDRGMKLSQIAESHRFCSRVQDAYTLRCVPQVHGIVHDTVSFGRSVIDVELNSATDNPLVFADRGEIKSGGNFHGEYPAKVLDYVAIAVHELAQMSERRVERLLNPMLSGLPDFLARDGGVNSGLMMVQVTAASLVSENKVLVHPSSADSIPTSANQEDHVSMGGFAARKVINILDNVENVLAMELMAACQGMEFLKPLTTTAPLQKLYNLVRNVSPAVERDRYLAPDIAVIARLLREQKVWLCVKPHIDQMLVADDQMHDMADGPHSPTAAQLHHNHCDQTDDAAADAAADAADEAEPSSKRTKTA